MSGKRNRGKRIGQRKKRCVSETLNALEGFREKTAIHGKRMSVLREMAEVKLDGACQDIYVLMRAQSVLTRREWPRTSPCFVCGEPTFVVHHVIQLQHGGADIDRNKVPICEPHHADVHEWLPTETDAEPNIWGHHLKPVATRKVYASMQWDMPKSWNEPLPPAKQPRAKLGRRVRRRVLQPVFDPTPRLVKRPDVNQ